MTERDGKLLKKLAAYQRDLASSMKEFRITSPNDLGKIHIMVRRGLVQTVGDMFELTVPMSSEVLEQLPLNQIIIKQFRNTASHRYDRITNEFAYACLMHCVDKEFVSVIKSLTLL
ncbi:MAG: hypothetical protein FWC89_00365 [Defluviitaleaceae bacterium]|nr:hypothetical protein [Defluviitaleaceae bacterium]